MKNLARKMCAKANHNNEHYMPKLGDAKCSEKAPDGSEAIEFLRMLFPRSSWVITAIIPDGPTETRTFGVTQQEAARAFIVAANKSGKNVYYSPPTRVAVSTKPHKKAIARTAYLHVDFDPKPDEAPEDFKERALKEIGEFTIQPTLVVDSGNGLQLLWLLQFPVELLDESSITRVEKCNIALAKALGAPPGTHNVDRLLRLPGTWNWPNAKKRKNGRKKCRARLLRSRGNRYRFGEFSALVAKHESSSELRRESKSPKILSSDDIPPKWASYLNIRDPKPGGYASRSELSQAFIMGCLKQGVSDATIISAMLDPRRAGCSIFEEAREKGGDEHLKRQISRARDAKDRTNPPEEKRRLTHRRVDQFERRNIEWVWWPFIPRGMVTMIFGDGEVGKSSIALDIAARITKGAAWPRFGLEEQEYAPSGSVLILTKEDDMSSIVRPRLEAAGADISRIYTLGYEVADDANQFDPVERLDTTVAEIERKIAELGDVRLVIVDPITDFMGAIDMYSDAQVRRLLNPIGRLAARYDLSVIIILHLNKKSDQPARHRGMGSVAFRNVCKSTLLVAKTDAPNERVLAQEKKNLTGEARAVTFRIPNATRGEYAHVEWGTDWEIADVDEILAEKKEKKLERAQQALHRWLSPGPVTVDELKKKVREERISWRTLCTAKKEISVESFRNPGERIFRWRLPKKSGRQRSS